MPLKLLLPLLLLVAGCGDAADAPEQVARTAGDGTLHFVTLNRLQGFAESIPCNERAESVLAGASGLRDRLAADGDTALLVALGDTLVPQDTYPALPALDIAWRARGEVVLESLGAAGLDAWVPGHADLAEDAEAVLDRAAALGIPVLISNTESSGRDDILPWIIVEADGLRVGCMALVANRSSDPRRARRARYPGFEMTPFMDGARQRARELEEQGVDLIVAFSVLPKKTNARLAEIAAIDVVIGSTDEDSIATSIVIDSSTALMSAAPRGREAGHTTLKIVDGNLQMADMSPVRYLPGFIEAEQVDVDRLVNQFGTSDASELARLAYPGNEGFFFDRLRLIDENREFVASMVAFEGSFIDHGRAELTTPPPDHPVLGVLAGQGQAIEAAYAGANMAAPPPPSEEPLIPLAQDCRQCHQSQYEFWSRSAHARAYDSLREESRHHDPACLSCHTTGFGDQIGWIDPRYEAPLGPVSCFECHGVSAKHFKIPRRVLDPTLFISDSDQMSCNSCHIGRRSPGFDRDREARVAQIACPPMAPDDPALLLARRRAIDSIERRKAEGIADAKDSYMLGRGLFALGGPNSTDAIAALHEAAEGLREDVGLTLEVARLLDEKGHSRDAQDVLRGYLALRTGELPVNLALVHLLLESTDVSARDPELAVATLSLLLPSEIGGEDSAIFLDFRLYQIDALWQTGRTSDATLVMRTLAPKHGRDPRLAERMTRYLGG